VRYLLLSLMLVLGGCDRPGRYQIEATRGSTPDDDRVWVLDTKTGRVSLCYEHAGAVNCLRTSAVAQQKEE
jgi:hypothetical protein